MEFKRKLRKQIDTIQIPSMEKALEKTNYKPNETRHRINIKNKLIMRRILVPSLCLILAFFTIFGAYAYSPEFKQYINMFFFKNNYRLTVEDLENWQKPIYTIDDLESMRENDGEYVLMNDLHFTDADYSEGGKFYGGFVPINDGVSIKSEDGKKWIETDKNIFFNGNGYVIHNLQIKAVNLNMVGLFGNVKQVINLGIDGCLINYTGAATRSDFNVFNVLNIGVIAGKADKVMGCYVINSAINIDLFGYPKGVAIGGICGKAELIDSCYGDTLIKGNINQSGSMIDYNARDNIKVNISSVYIGGIVGISDACITSYYYGNLDFITTDNSEGIIADNIAAKSLNVPRIMHKSQFDLVVSDLRDALNDESCQGKDKFHVDKFSAYYKYVSNKNLTTLEKQDMLATWPSFQDYYFCDVSTWSYDWYIFDPNASLGEEIAIMDILKIIYTDQEIIEMFDRFGVKYDKYSCKTIMKDQKYQQKDFEDFDFKHIWIMKTGKPALQIFQK